MVARPFLILIVLDGFGCRRESEYNAIAQAEKPRFDRKYEAKEIWAHYTYFFRAVLPVAEKADVKLALHRDDPPVPMMNGVAKIFTHYEGYRRAEELAGKSNHWGLTFCVGTWSEGGKEMGKDVFEMIGDFGRRGREGRRGQHSERRLARSTTVPARPRLPVPA